MQPPSTTGEPMVMGKCRKRTKAGVYTADIKLEDLESRFNLPSNKAAESLGVGLTIFKRICRRFGLQKWPYRQLLKQKREERRAAGGRRDYSSSDTDQDEGDDSGEEGDDAGGTSGGSEHHRSSKRQRLSRPPSAAAAAAQPVASWQQAHALALLPGAGLLENSSAWQQQQPPQQQQLQQQQQQHFGLPAVPSWQGGLSRFQHPPPGVHFDAPPPSSQQQQQQAQAQQAPLERGLAQGGAAGFPHGGAAAAQLDVDRVTVEELGARGPSTNSFIGLWEALQNKQPQHPPAPAQQGALPLDEQTLQEVRREQLLQQYSGIGGAGQMAGGTLTLPAGFDPWGFSLQGFSLNLDGDFGVGPLAPPPPLPPQGSGGVSVAAAAPAPGALPSQLGQPPPPQVPAQQQAVQQAQQAHQHQQQQADARAMPPPEAQQAQQAHVYRPKPLVRPPSSTGLSGMAASDANNTRVAAPADALSSLLAKRLLPRAAAAPSPPAAAPAQHSPLDAWRLLQASALALVQPPAPQAAPSPAPPQLHQPAQLDPAQQLLQLLQPSPYDSTATAAQKAAAQRLLTGGDGGGNGGRGNGGLPRPPSMLFSAAAAGVSLPSPSGLARSGSISSGAAAGSSWWALDSPVLGGRQLSPVQQARQLEEQSAALTQLVGTLQKEIQSIEAQQQQLQQAQQVQQAAAAAADETRARRHAERTVQLRQLLLLQQQPGLEQAEVHALAQLIAGLRREIAASQPQQPPPAQPPRQPVTAAQQQLSQQAPVQAPAQRPRQAPVQPPAQQPRQPVTQQRQPQYQHQTHAVPPPSQELPRGDSVVLSQLISGLQKEINSIERAHALAGARSAAGATSAGHAHPAPTNPDSHPQLRGSGSGHAIASIDRHTSSGSGGSGPLAEAAPIAANPPMLTQQAVQLAAGPAFEAAPHSHSLAQLLHQHLGKLAGGGGLPPRPAPASMAAPLGDGGGSGGSSGGTGLTPLTPTERDAASVAAAAGPGPGHGVSQSAAVAFLTRMSAVHSLQQRLVARHQERRQQALALAQQRYCQLQQALMADRQMAAARLAAMRAQADQAGGQSPSHQQQRLQAAPSPPAAAPTVATPSDSASPSPSLSTSPSPCAQEPEAAAGKPGVTAAATASPARQQDDSASLELSLAPMPRVHITLAPQQAQQAQVAAASQPPPPVQYPAAPPQPASAGAAPASEQQPSRRSPDRPHAGAPPAAS